MKVLCLYEGKYWTSKNSGRQEIGPEYNEICTVSEEGDDYYCLEEYPITSTGIAAFNKKWFIPLSDKDETEYADEVLESIFQPVKF